MDFVRHCQDRYFDHGITPTENAHSPLPKCMGGTDTVLLTRQDHAKHDVLQTECYGEGTLTAFYFRELVGTTWENRARKALSLTQSRGGKTQGKRNVESGMWLENCRKGGEVMGKINKETGQVYTITTPESLKKGGKVTSSQKWKCLVTGHVSTPGPLSRYQNARGIDTSLRKRIV